VKTVELFKRQKIAEEVVGKLKEAAKQRAAESDKATSHLPNETRAILRVCNGLLLWLSEGYPDEILWFYQYGSKPCWQRMSMFDRDVNTAIILLKDKGKAALAADVEGRWQNIIRTARKADKTLSELAERYNNDEDNPAYANDVKSALFDIKTYASQLGDSLLEVAKQQASEANTQGKNNKGRKTKAEKIARIAAHLQVAPHASSKDIGDAIGVDESDVRRLWKPIKQAMQEAKKYKAPGSKVDGKIKAEDESASCKICCAPLSGTFHCEHCKERIMGECKTCHYTNAHTDDATP